MKNKYLIKTKDNDVFEIDEVTFRLLYSCEPEIRMVCVEVGKTWLTMDEIVRITKI